MHNIVCLDRTFEPYRKCQIFISTLHWGSIKFQRKMVKSKSHFHYILGGFQLTSFLFRVQNEPENLWSVKGSSGTHCTLYHVFTLHAHAQVGLCDQGWCPFMYTRVSMRYGDILHEMKASEMSGNISREMSVMRDLSYSYLIGKAHVQ